MKNHILLLSVLLLLSFSSCKKELRSKVYTLAEYNSSGMSGTVSFIETSNKNVTTVRLVASNLQPNVVYPTHLHTGTLDSLINTLVNFKDLETATGQITRDEPWNISFDEAIESNTCFNLHNPTYTANNYTGYFLAGNTGRNAP